MTLTNCTKILKCFKAVCKNFTALFRFFYLIATTSVLATQALAQDADCKVTKEMSVIPDEIYVEIYPVIITSVDELQEAFDYQFYIGYSFEIDEDLDYCFFESQDLSEGIFDPRFEFMNAIDIERITPFGVEIEDSEIYVDAKYKGTFKGKLDFTFYPFDNQDLHINISSTYSTDDFKIHLEEQTNLTTPRLSASTTPTPPHIRSHILLSSPLDGDRVPRALHEEEGNHNLCHILPQLRLLPLWPLREQSRRAPRPHRHQHAQGPRLPR